MIARSRIGFLLAGVLLALAAVGPASAQGRRGGGMFGMMGRSNPMMLLGNKSVQDELKMTSEQTQKLGAKQQELREAMREAFQNGQGDPDARRTMMTKMQEMQQKAVSDVLDAGQQKRFRQIQLQQSGPSAINRKDVADELKLTEEQRKKAEDIQQASMAEMQSMMQGVDFRNMTQDERQQMGQKMQAMQKAASDKYVAVLSDGQKSQWKEMLGAPFKLVMPERRQQ